MSKFKLTLTRADGHPDGVTPTPEVVVYTQHFDELNVSELICELNRPRRTYKPRAPKPAKA